MSNITKKVLLSFGLALLVLAVLPAISRASDVVVSCSKPDNNSCNDNCTDTEYVTETPSSYISSAWAPGAISWDDYISYAAVFNTSNVLFLASAGPTACGGGGAGSGGGPGNTFFNAGPGQGHTDSDTLAFTLTDFQKRTVDVNAEHGSADFGYSMVYCSYGQITKNDSCQNVAGTISSNMTSCAGSCSPTLSWNITTGNSANNYGSVYGWNGSTFTTLGTGQSGSYTISNLGPGSWVYYLQAYDGYGSYADVGSVTITVSSASPPTASLTINGSSSATVTIPGSATIAWSSTNGSSYSSTVVNSNSGAGCNTSPIAWVANTASGSVSTGATNSSQAACGTYTITYTVTSSGGAQASSSITMNIVNPTGALNATWLGGGTSKTTSIAPGGSTSANLNFNNSGPSGSVVHNPTCSFSQGSFTGNVSFSPNCTSSDLTAP